MKKNYKRKYLIDAPFQLKQVSVLIVANLLIVLLISALLSWFYLIAWDGNAAYNHNRLIPIYIATTALLVTLATIFLSFRRSRAIAGMMHKLQLVLEDAALGVLPERRLVFRKSDYFQQLATPLNNCFDLIRSGQNVDSYEIAKDLNNIIVKLETEDADHTELQNRLAELIKKLQ